MSQALNSSTAGAPTHSDYGATSHSSHPEFDQPEVTFSSAGFSPTEFMSLSQDIGQNINAINASAKQLERAQKQIGPTKDLAKQCEKVHKINARTNDLVDATQRKLQRLAEVVGRGNRQQNMQLDKLKSEFRSVVEKYATVQKRISQATRQSWQQSSALDSEAEVLASAQQMQRERQEIAQLNQENELLLEREQQVVQIEKDIIDVNHIMSKISGLVHEQQEALDTIEGNVERSGALVEEGRSELEKAERSRQSHRRKILILLVIAVIIGLIVTGIIVSKLS